MRGASTELPVQARSQQSADQDLRPVHVGVRQDECELVAADAERAIGAAHVGGHRRRRLAQHQVARGVATGVVEALEVVEVEERERHRAAGPGGDGPLPLHLLLERAVIAEAGQRVAQRFGPCPVIGVLEDAPALLETFGRLEDASRQPHGQRAQEQGHGEEDDRRDEERRARPRGQPVDEGRGDEDGDREHDDEREEQAETDQSQVRRLA